MVRTHPIVGSTAGRRRSGARATLPMASLATLLVLVNFTAPISALPETAGALGADAAGQTWILGSISLGLAAALLIAGSLADNYGRRLVFALGAVGLALGSVVCAAAPTTLVFVLGRVLQGVASAALLASSLGLIAHAFPAGPDRARATGVWGAMIGGGIALGPVFSAVLTAASHWRAVYWLIGALALGIAAGAPRAMSESRSDQRRRLDIAGLLTLGPGVAFLVAAVTDGRDGWTSPSVLAFLTVAAMLLGGFVVAERRGTDPMLDLQLLRRPEFLAATIGALLTGVSVVGFMTYLPTLTQRVLGLGPLASAGVLGVWSGISFVVAIQARRLTSRVGGRHQVAVGLALCGLGELAMLGITQQSSWWQLAPGLAIAGVGTGLANAALAGLAVQTVPPDRVAMGSGANNTARYVGSSLGIATVAAVLTLAPADANPAHELAIGMNYAAAVAALLAFTGALITTLCKDRPALKTTRAESTV